MSNKTGGPAFPELGNVGYNSDWQCEAGMTLRDYFAAKAMQAAIPHMGNIGVGQHEDNMRLATASYAVADAMLRAREAS